MKTITNEVYDIKYPDLDKCLDQDKEWIEVKQNGKYEKVRIHDYDTMYSIPGLYEEVIYNHLECCSPAVVCSLLKKEVENEGISGSSLNVLDFGAGNGIVGEFLKNELHCNTIFGVDIIPEAKEGAERDRSEIYDEYFVMDMSSLSEQEREQLLSRNINTLITVAALGFGDIPTQAFKNACTLLPKDGWIAFNIKDEFLSDKDRSGFHEELEEMMDKEVTVSRVHRYCHRKSLHGEKLYYYAIIGKKLDRE